MSVEDLIKDLINSLEYFEKMMEDPNEKEKHKDSYVYAVTVLGYLEELKQLRVVNKNISRGLITRTDNLKKVNKEAQKYFDLLMEDEKVINEMAKEICFKEPLRYNNAQEVIDYFRKKCE